MPPRRTPISKRCPTQQASLAKNLLYDLAHACGKADAALFKKNMKLDSPIAALSAGPVFFAYSGRELLVLTT